MNDIDSQISELENKINTLREQKKKIASMSPSQKLATYLHNSFCVSCVSSHNDMCGWFYEDDDWTRYAHSTWLKRANELRQFIADDPSLHS